MIELVKQDFINQYNHAFRVLKSLVTGFDINSWKYGGRKGYSPARISYHILHSVKYYIEDTSIIQLSSGKDLEMNWVEVSQEELLSQSELLSSIEIIQKRSEDWLHNLNCEEKINSFPWAGETRLGIALFAIRHFQYHLGELSSLLNESKQGEVEDIYVKENN